MKFYRVFFISLLLLSFVWAGLVFFQTGMPTKTSQWVFDVYEKKTMFAEQIKSPKLVIVSGSNALFGIDSTLLEKEFKLKTINYSVNAGILLPYTLYKAKQVIKPHDVVLLPLEYSMYNYSGKPNSQMIDYIFSRDFSSFFMLTFKEQFYLFWNVTLQRIYDGYQALGGKAIVQGLYGAHNIDSAGDQINTRLENRSKSMWNEVNNHKANHYGRDFNDKDLAWHYLSDFIAWCRHQEVTCLFMPSTLMKFDAYFNDKKEQWFYNNIAHQINSIGGVYIGHPYDYMYDKGLYFNTDYHLINKGRTMRTKKIVSDLRSSVYADLFDGSSD